MVVVAAKTTSTTCSLPKTTRARPAAARLAPIAREAGPPRASHAFFIHLPLANQIIVPAVPLARGFCAQP